VPKALSKANTGALSKPTTGPPIITGVEHAAKKRPRRQNHPGTPKGAPVSQAYAASPASNHNNLYRFALGDNKSSRSAQEAPHDFRVPLLVTLGSWTPNGGTPRTVQSPELDSRSVNRPSLDPTHCVQFRNQVSLADTSSRRVTRHLADRFLMERYHTHRDTHARSSHRRFDTGVPCTDNNDVPTRLGHPYFPTQKAEKT
jgi:hypothetical protein